MIKFDRVGFAYSDGKKIFDSLSFEIKPGEQVAVVGGNGSGKTTLMLLIDGILTAGSGKIEIDGLNPACEKDRGELRRKVGFVFQDPDNQLVSTTVEREIAFSLENMNVRHPELADRVQRLIDGFGMRAMMTRLTSELSGGEKQKLALAAVMVTRPSVLILDEPGSFLDESGKRLLSRTVKDLVAQNPRLIVLRVTQYARVAMEYERIIVLHNGAIVADGSASEVYGELERCHRWSIDVPLQYRLSSMADFAGNNRAVEPERFITGSDVSGSSIRLQDVSFGYDPNNAILGQVNAVFESGRVYAVVGPSGSGKSTLLQILAGLLKPTGGHIVYDGFEPWPGNIALSFQQAEKQFFLETVDKELRFGAENLAIGYIDDMIEQCYQAIDFERVQFADRDPFTLSGGEQRRLAFGTILAVDPKFVLFDEPTCALDARGTDLFMGLVRRLQAKGKAVVLVSHDGNLALELAEKIYVMDNGTLSDPYGKETFFRSVDYSAYLSMPGAIKYQLDKMGRIEYLSERELLKAHRAL